MIRRKSQQGFTIIIAMVFTAILLTLAVGVIGYSSVHSRSERQAVYGAQALRIAEGGLDKAIAQLNQNGLYTGETNTVLGGGTFTVTVNTVDSNNKRITVVGYVPNNVSPVATKTVAANVSIDLSQVAFNFGVQVGALGLVMSNNSQINGNVFSNGPISGSGIITGDAVAALGGNPAADQQWTTYDSEYTFGSVSARRDLAQKFLPGVSNKLNYVSLFLRKVGNPGDITVRIVTDNNGEPSKSVVASSTISSSQITSTLGFVDASFATPPSLNAGQPYWIIASPPSVNASNYFGWGIDTTDAYASGTGKYTTNWNASSPVWNATNSDLNFKTFMGGVVNPLTGVTIFGSAHAELMDNCTINVDAYFQTNSGCSVGGAEYPATDPPGPATMPVSASQIANWKSVAENGGTITGPYVVTGTVTMGPKKIDGDMSFENGATLILTGPIWVKGNLTIDNNATVRISNSVGANSVAVVADNPDNPSGSGLITVSNNVTLLSNNSPGSYIMLLSTKSGTAIDLSNNATGAIFYSANGFIDVDNNAGAAQLTGYGISLKNNAVVNYSTGLQSNVFSNGPGGSWQYVPGTFVISN